MDKIQRNMNVRKVYEYFMNISKFDVISRNVYRHTLLNGKWTMEKQYLLGMKKKKIEFCSE